MQEFLGNIYIYIGKSFSTLWTRWRFLVSKLRGSIKIFSKPGFLTNYTWYIFWYIANDLVATKRKAKGVWSLNGPKQGR